MKSNGVVAISIRLLTQIASLLVTCSFNTCYLHVNLDLIRPHWEGVYSCLVTSTPLGGWTYYFYFFRLGFRSFQGKVFILSLPNLVWVFIGLIACMGLHLVKIALKLVE